MSIALLIQCPRCHGEGRHNYGNGNVPCIRCNGFGSVRKAVTSAAEIQRQHMKARTGGRTSASKFEATLSEIEKEKGHAH